jgi:hypothetical protein
MSNDRDIPTRGRSTTKKALLIGIAYRAGTGRQGQTLEYIPTSVPNVRAFEKFLRGGHSLSSPIISLTYTTPSRLTESQGYTDITVMTDEEGVEEKYQPTKSNLVRNFPQPLPTSTDPNDALPETRN